MAAVVMASVMACRTPPRSVATGTRGAQPKHQSSSTAQTGWLLVRMECADGYVSGVAISHRLAVLPSLVLELLEPCAVELTELQLGEQEREGEGLRGREVWRGERGDG